VLRRCRSLSVGDSNEYFPKRLTGRYAVQVEKIRLIRLYFGVFITVGLGFLGGFLVAPGPSVATEFHVQVELASEFGFDPTKSQGRVPWFNGSLGPFQTALNALPQAVQARVFGELSREEVRGLRLNDFRGVTERDELGALSVTFFDDPGFIDLTSHELEVHLSELTQTYEFLILSIVRVETENFQSEVLSGWQFGLLFALGAGFLYSITVVGHNAIRASQVKPRQTKK